jgi:hypothetical protein
MADQLSLLSRRQEPANAWPYPPGWHPDELPADIAAMVTAEPVLARLGAALQGQRDGWTDVSRAPRYLRTYWAPRLLGARRGLAKARASDEQPPRPPRGEAPTATRWEWVETPNPHGPAPYGRLRPVEESDR